jgi:hypothetical protein
MKNRLTVLASLVVLGIAVPCARADHFPTSAGVHQEYTGIVTAVDPQSHVLTFKSPWPWRDRHFSPGNNCTYSIRGRNPGFFDDLRPGEKVTVSYRTAHGVAIADRIQQEEMVMRGVVTAVDLNQRTLTLRHDRLVRTLAVANDCTVHVQGAKALKLDAVQPGTFVSVIYRKPNDVSIAQQIDQTSSSFAGRLTRVDLENRTLQAQAASQTMTFRIGDNCTVDVHGKSNARLADLAPNENLQFTYENVNGVNIVERIAPAPNPPAHAAARNNRSNSTYTPYMGPMPSY